MHVAFKFFLVIRKKKEEPKKKKEFQKQKTKTKHKKEPNSKIPIKDVSFLGLAKYPLSKSSASVSLKVGK